MIPVGGPFLPRLSARARTMSLYIYTLLLQVKLGAFCWPNVAFGSFLTAPASLRGLYSRASIPDYKAQRPIYVQISADSPTSLVPCLGYCLLGLLSYPAKIPIGCALCTPLISFQKVYHESCTFFIYHMCI